jgi:ribosome-binding protein aMBF1 (putative translation factor)
MLRLVRCLPTIRGVNLQKFSNFGIMIQDKSMLIKFGNRVKRLRTDQNISQEELAYRCNFYRTYIGMVERAERNITLGNIVKIANGLNITLEQLFNEEELNRIDSL